MKKSTCHFYFEWMVHGYISLYLNGTEVQNVPFKTYIYCANNLIIEYLIEQFLNHVPDDIYFSSDFFDNYFQNVHDLYQGFLLIYWQQNFCSSFFCKYKLSAIVVFAGADRSYSVMENSVRSVWIQRSKWWKSIHEHSCHIIE